MRKLLQSLPLFIFTAALLTGCGKTLIKDQKSEELSAVTMYLDVNNFVIEGISIKNLDTGRTFYNKRYGWGEEYFPAGKKFSYVAIGNIDAGRYSIDKVVFWYFPPGKDKKENMELKIPDDVFRFAIAPGDILYLGDINFTILDTNYNEKILQNTISGLEEKKFTVKRFRTFIPYRGSESDVVYINGIEPSGGSSFRPAEEFFLKFFVSKKSDIPGWAEIAEKKLKFSSDFERNQILNEIERQ